MTLLTLRGKECKENTLREINKNIETCDVLVFNAYLPAYSFPTAHKNTTQSAKKSDIVHEHTFNRKLINDIS